MDICKNIKIVCILLVFMTLQKQENFSDEGVNGAHVLGTIFASFLTVICPLLGAPLLAVEYQNGRKLASGRKVTEGEDSLDEMIGGEEDTLMCELYQNRLHNERFVSITHSAVIPQNPSSNSGLFYVPGRVTKTTTYDWGKSNE